MGVQCIDYNIVTLCKPIQWHGVWLMRDVFTMAQAFLGEVATWTGIVTGTLMFASPALFARWKWKGVAGATPAFMLWTGVPFFVGCVLYNVAHPTQGVGTAALRALVIVGAVLQVRQCDTVVYA